MADIECKMEIKEPLPTQVELYEQALAEYYRLRHRADEQVAIVNNLWSKLTTEERQRFLG